MPDEEKARFGSWSGSERQRRDQGNCLPRGQPAGKKRFIIPVGTRLAITKLTPTRWIAHTTVVELGFDCWESYKDSYFTFRHLGYFILVHRDRVKSDYLLVTDRHKLL